MNGTVFWCWSRASGFEDGAGVEGEDGFLDVESEGGESVGGFAGDGDFAEEYHGEEIGGRQEASEADNGADFAGFDEVGLCGDEGAGFGFGNVKDVEGFVIGVEDDIGMGLYDIGEIEAELADELCDHGDFFDGLGAGEGNGLVSHGGGAAVPFRFVAGGGEQREAFHGEGRGLIAELGFGKALKIGGEFSEGMGFVEAEQGAGIVCGESIVKDSDDVSGDGFHGVASDAELADDVAEFAEPVGV